MQCPDAQLQRDDGDDQEGKERPAVYGAAVMVDGQGGLYESGAAHQRNNTGHGQVREKEEEREGEEGVAESDGGLQETAAGNYQPYGYKIVAGTTTDTHSFKTGHRHPFHGGSSKGHISWGSSADFGHTSIDGLHVACHLIGRKPCFQCLLKISPFDGKTARAAEGTEQDHVGQYGIAQAAGLFRGIDKDYMRGQRPGLCAHIFQ